MGRVCKYYQLVVVQPIHREGPKTRWQLQSMYKHLHINNFALQQKNSIHTLFEHLIQAASVCSSSNSV